MRTDPMDVMVDDLARQVAQKAIEAASWKARAISAEEALAELQEDDGAVEETEESD